MKNWTSVDADVVKLMTKHYTPGRSGRKINKIVLHHNGGRLTTEQCWQVWQTREASAHYQVEVTGRIGQLVWDRDTAWHAANLTANRESIGIEHANNGGPTAPISEATLDNGAHLVAALCRIHGLGRPQWHVNVFGHKDFTSTDCPGHIYSDQRAAYMARAQRWYDAMGSAPAGGGSGSKPVPPTTTPSPEEDDMPTPQEIADAVAPAVASAVWNFPLPNYGPDGQPLGTKKAAFWWLVWQDVFQAQTIAAIDAAGLTPDEIRQALADGTLKVQVSVTPADGA